MNYTIEDINYIKSWLYKCIQIKIPEKNIYNKTGSIYYITNKNIQRHLKYNKLLNKQTPSIFKLKQIPNDCEVIFILYETKNKYVNITLNEEIQSYFKDKYNIKAPSLLFNFIRIILNKIIQ